MRPSPLPTFTSRETDLLLARWEQTAATLMNRDGTNEQYEDGGHRIKQDPLLTRAIEKIRDGYFELFNLRRKLEDKQRLGDVSAEAATAIKDVEYDLVVWNHHSYTSLQQPSYGLSPDEVRKLDSAECPGLSTKDATLITGSIIKRSINAFEITFARDHAKRPTVPHVPLKSLPEQTRRTRSIHPPKVNWGEEVTSAIDSAAQYTTR
jgi:hypothetical protein